jgi:hypothetical protein
MKSELTSLIDAMCISNKGVARSLIEDAVIKSSILLRKIEQVLIILAEGRADVMRARQRIESLKEDIEEGMEIMRSVIDDDNQDPRIKRYIMRSIEKSVDYIKEINYDIERLEKELTVTGEINKSVMKAYLYN